MTGRQVPDVSSSAGAGQPPEGPSPVSSVWAWRTVASLSPSVSIARISSASSGSFLQSCWEGRSLWSLALVRHDCMRLTHRWHLVANVAIHSAEMRAQLPGPPLWTHGLLCAWRLPSSDHGVLPPSFHVARLTRRHLREKF